ncbi:MAG: hypothetical protein WC789_10600 [Lentisphaeria bacterium]
MPRPDVEWWGIACCVDDRWYVCGPWTEKQVLTLIKIAPWANATIDGKRAPFFSTRASAQAKCDNLNGLAPAARIDAALGKGQTDNERRRAP